MNDADNFAAAGNGVAAPAEDELVDDRDPAFDDVADVADVADDEDAAPAVVVEGVGADVVAGLWLSEAAFDNAESSLLQAATASKAAPNAPLRAARREITAYRENSERVMTRFRPILSWECP